MGPGGRTQESPPGEDEHEELGDLVVDDFADPHLRVVPVLARQLGGKPRSCRREAILWGLRAVLCATVSVRSWAAGEKRTSSVRAQHKPVPAGPSNLRVWPPRRRPQQPASSSVL